MLDLRVKLIRDTGKSGRAATERSSMARPRYQNGSLVVRGKPKRYVLRWKEDVVEADGTVNRIHHAETIGLVSKIKKQQAREILKARVSAASQQQRQQKVTMTLGILGHAARFGGITAFTELLLDAAATAAQAAGVGIGIIIAANRTRHPMDARTLARLAAQFAGRGVVGFGLSNDERRGSHHSSVQLRAPMTSIWAM